MGVYRLKRPYLTLAVFLLVFLAACGEQQPAADDTAPADDSPAADPAAPDNQADEQQPQDEPEAAAKTADASDDLDKLFARQASLSFQVAYDTTTVAQGETIESEFTQYIKGENRIRIDMSAEGYDGRTYILDEKVYTCMNQDDWQCLTFEGEQTEVATTDVKDDYEENKAKYTITKIADRTVAGASCDCYLLETTEPEESTVEYCFSKEAVPLYIKMTADKVVSEMIATSYSTSVPDSVFELPAEPTTFDAQNFDPSQYAGMYG